MTTQALKQLFQCTDFLQKSSEASPQPRYTTT